MDNIPLPRRSRLWKSKTDFFRPFRSAAEAAGENIVPLYDPQLVHENDEENNLKDLNTCLTVLVDVFPDVEPEVFREMLLNVSEESRIQLVSENMLKRKGEWARGRKANLSRKQGSKKMVQAAVLTPEDMFRGDDYREAVKQVFYQEFKALSHSTIKGVMAEWNHSYSLSRPILQHLSTKSWRFALPSFFFRRPSAQTSNDHPYIIWQVDSINPGHPVPAVKRTGCAQLDHELYQLFVDPVLTRQREQQQAADFAYASKLNEEDAAELEALFECECCYDTVTFEQISTCDTGSHQLCFACLRRTVKEALYGQGWARTADLEKNTVRCFSPLAQDCQGTITQHVVQNALANGTDNNDTWEEFQRRATNETLIKSRLALQRCPFCTYAEVNDAPTPKFRSPQDIYHYLAAHVPSSIQLIFICLLGLLTTIALPILIIIGIVYSLSLIIITIYPPAAHPLTSSWTRVHKRRRGQKFKCLNPTCLKTSCIRCNESWRDPHICFESEKTSLRTAIEASATAAIKRTCPKCLLSFVKSSGCNKLVCNCGYTMCYVCRQEITSKEGYGHFCQHFRPNGGRCQECERCDLYGNEDEEAAIRKAAETAEKVWREKEGAKERGQEATQLMVEAFVEQTKPLRGYEMLLDVIVDALIAS